MAPVRVVGNGCCVKRDDQYGYAKTFGIGPELLASCLAQLVGAAVPRAEEGRVKGNNDPSSFLMYGASTVIR